MQGLNPPWCTSPTVVSDIRPRGCTIAPYLEREILALPAAEREWLATVAWESLVDNPSAAGDRNTDAEGIEIAA